MTKRKSEAETIDTSKPHQVLQFGEVQYTSDQGVLEFVPTMHGYKLTIITTEHKESSLAPQERTIIQEIYLNVDGKITAQFTNAQDWRVLRPSFSIPKTMLSQ